MRSPTPREAQQTVIAAGDTLRIISDAIVLPMVDAGIVISKSTTGAPGLSTRRIICKRDVIHGAIKRISDSAATSFAKHFG